MPTGTNSAPTKETVVFTQQDFMAVLDQAMGGYMADPHPDGPDPTPREHRLTRDELSAIPRTFDALLCAAGFAMLEAMMDGMEEGQRNFGQAPDRLYPSQVLRPDRQVWAESFNERMTHVFRALEDMDAESDDNTFSSLESLESVESQ